MRNVERFIVILLLLAAVAIPACSQKEAQPVPGKGTESKASAEAVTTASGLSYTDMVKGTGAAPTSGKNVTVHYTGVLENGTKFDSSVDRGQPFVFRIGAGDEGVISMKVGGKRKLVIPPHLAYGSAGAGGVVPPDATLIFEVELLDVEN